MCSFKNIDVLDTYEKGDRIIFTLAIPDYYKLRDINRKVHPSIKLCSKSGILFKLIKILGKYTVFAGLLCFLIFVLINTRRITKIQIEGINTNSYDEYVDFLYGQGIKEGTNIKNIDYALLCDKLRNNFETISWVTVFSEGTVLNVIVKENDTDSKVNSNTEYRSIFSNTSGVISRIITRAGTPVVKEGDTVCEGQLLISGQIDTYNEYGELMSTEFVHADGDIYIIATENINFEINRFYEITSETGYSFSEIKIPALRIVFKISPFHKSLAESISQIYELPYGISKTDYKEVNITTHERTDAQMEDILIEKLEKYLYLQEKKGIQTGDKNVKIAVYADKAVIEGEITVIKPIVYGEATDIEYN